MKGFILFFVMVLTAFPMDHTAWALDGRVIDNTTGEGIADAIVTVNDRVVITDAAGRFQLAATADRVLARACGYLATSYPIEKFVKSGGTIGLTAFVPRALYLSAYGIASKVLRGEALTLIHRGPFNALVIDIKTDRGMIPYPSEVPLARIIGARQVTTISDLDALVKSLHSQGIYAIARIVVFKDDPLANAKPNLAVKRKDGQLFRDGEGLSWTDPFQAEVRNYNIAVAVEAARAGFDEIQFDYLRFPDVVWRLQLSQPATETARMDGLDTFLGEARHELMSYNVFLSVDIFGYVCWNTNDTGIGQKLERIAIFVDYLCPMLYPSGFQFGIPGYRMPIAYPYEIVRLSLENAQHRLNIPAKRFRPWIQGFHDYAFDHRPYEIDEVRSQVRAASDFGSDGWMLWNPRNRYFPID